MDPRTSQAALLQAPDATSWGSVLVPHARPSVPPARWAIMDSLRGRSGDAALPEGLLSDVAIVVSELLGNAVRHAAALPGGDVLLRWRVEAGQVQVEVVDGGGGPLNLGRPSLVATGGRGLAIIGQLSSRWGSWVDDRNRRTVWAVLTSAPGTATSRVERSRRLA